MNSKSTLPIFVLSLALSFSLNLLSQCEEGETAIEFVIDTDTWGYEMYWELTPSGSGCGSADFLASGGNSENVGCDGGDLFMHATGIRGAEVGKYHEVADETRVEYDLAEEAKGERAVDVSLEGGDELAISSGFAPRGGRGGRGRDRWN